ncbi:MAG: 7-carboxy-7-deazaguanine synthase QueE, partial [Candidatus Thermoplasmatota archaeon]|nr:7-carboxy-7-deazaguanine synthase QueE [Candidatus Thermoplasmatota archaeon]
GGEEDYGYALKVLEEHPPQCQIVFTPVGGIDMKWLAEKVLEDGVAVRVLPQLHKLLWGNERKR